ncbi:hypothetical protein V8G54_005237 [Vigna mungo]|uniref:Uncharacterized protein n=1 Tax=Vigna mungo TaxID=3915 RepID=A0AAQ3PJE9_VIGMU
MVKDNLFHYMCRNHPKYENGDGMPSSILQRMHRKIHAPWVGPYTAAYAIYLIDLIGLVNILAACCTVLTNSNWFYCSINECPICRVHVPSRRSLREDPNFDKLIAALVPDIDKYEEEVRRNWLFFRIGVVMIKRMLCLMLSAPHNYY